MTKNTANIIKSAVSVIKKNHAAMKPLHKFAFAILLCFYLTGSVWFSFAGLFAGFVSAFIFGILIAIPWSVISAFAVILGGALFKLTLPQEDYIKKSRLDLILGELVTCLFISIVSFTLPLGAVFFILGHLFGWDF